MNERFVDATCWCEERLVRIPTQWVGTRTRSCGLTGCKAPDAKIAPSTSRTGRAHCGTINGYLWHLANNSDPCRPCRIAWGCTETRPA